MIEATSCGGVVIFRGKILVLYKNYKNKYEGWVLPKGTVEAGEEYKETALREVKEETGVSASIIKYIGKSQYSFNTPQDVVEKDVHWYLMMADSYYSKPQREEYFLDSGYYMLVTGSRMASGAVLSNITFFNVKPEATTDIELVMRESKEQVQVIGNFDSESLYRPLGDEEIQSTSQSILQTCGRGYFVVGVLGVGQEPTNHALRDIAALGSEFEKWGRKIVLLFPSEEQYKKFHPAEFQGLPSTIAYGVDIDNRIQNQIAKSMNLSNSDILPMFIIADTFNRVVFVSQGYTIGLGEQLMKTIHGL